MATRKCGTNDNLTIFLRQINSLAYNAGMFCWWHSAFGWDSIISTPMENTKATSGSPLQQSSQVTQITSSSGNNAVLLLVTLETEKTSF